MNKKEVLEKRYPLTMFFIVRMYDRFDREWIECSGELDLDEAISLWNENTKNGTEHIDYDDGYYYDIFPLDTQMLYRYK